MNQCEIKIDCLNVVNYAIQQIRTLERLGWNILRVWSLDYWSNRDKTIARLAEQLNALMVSEPEPQAADEVEDVKEVWACYAPTRSLAQRSSTQ